MDKLTLNLTVRIDEETRERLVELNQREPDVKLSLIVRRLLLSGLDRQGKQCTTLHARRLA